LYVDIGSRGDRSGISDAEVPVSDDAMVSAEILYEFHSFTLECMAFLATWGVLDGFLLLFVALFGPKSRRDNVSTA
jgi:hypothetical protein